MKWGTVLRDATGGQRLKGVEEPFSFQVEWETSRAWLRGRSLCDGWVSKNEGGEGGDDGSGR